ncbi:E3 ubiquitin-protein ligase TRIM69-like [Sinocyclocheilus grahami]|uniref:E3 ubiquitin-protein ligase TRIM69-like n=1 Tax=Sinocyclocheilus grahami TaxID=75366 RepID=UPI0007AD6929|nr:PREDICTED: E3 ubiquitin-protein ligase TRIM69-like [Sinocyclocheilus grahami]
MKRALIQLKKTLNGSLNEKLRQSRLKCLKFAVDVTLDPDSANPYLILSDDGKQVSHGNFKQDVPENPKRLNNTCCVLAKQGFSSGRFYYEVQVKGKTEWDLGVVRESIKRKKTNTLTPVNGFWTVILRNGNQYKACESPSVSFSLKVKPEKVGVFVDYEEGLVSFYDVGSRSHIYSFTGQTFTEKLYPYFSPCRNEGGKNSNPLIISPVNRYISLKYET